MRENSSARTVAWLGLFIVGTLAYLSSLGVMNAYDVRDASSNGYVVTVEDGVDVRDGGKVADVWIRTPDHQGIQVTGTNYTANFAAVGYNFDPNTTVYCSWDPNHTWLVIFIPDDRATATRVFNLKKHIFLDAKMSDWDKYPDWFGPLLRSYPKEWKGNKLIVDSVVKPIDGNAKIRSLREVLTINDDSYQYGVAK